MRSRTIRGLLGGALGLVMVQGCADRSPLGPDGSHGGGSEGFDDSETGEWMGSESGQSESGSSESGADGSSGDDWVDSVCDDSRAIVGMPYGIATPEWGPDGALQLRVDLHSLPLDCGPDVQTFEAGKTRITFTIPAATEAPATFDLAEQSGVARMGAAAPGNPGSVPTLALLQGAVDIGALDDRSVVGTLDDSVVPFHGCFTAVRCEGP